MGKEKEKRERAVITAQGQLDSAPSSGKRAYLKLPEGLKLFVPEKNRTYKLIFLPWKGSKLNTSRDPVSKWTTNRFFAVHARIGPGEVSVLCLARLKGQPCAVCEEFGRLKAQQADWDKVLSPLKYKERELFFVHNTEIPKSLYVWDESIHLFGDAFRQKIRKKARWLQFADFDNGCIVEVEAKEKKMGANSCVDMTTGIEIEERPEPLSDWLANAAEKYCLDDCLIEMPYAAVKKALGQTAGAEEEEDETEVAEAEETEDEVEEPEEEEAAEEEEAEEEEEKPIKKSATTTKKPTRKPEPAEEEEEAEEEEVEEPEEEEEAEEETEEEEEVEEEEVEEPEEEEEEEKPKKPPVKKPGDKTGKKPTEK